MERMISWLWTLFMNNLSDQSLYLRWNEKVWILLIKWSLFMNEMRKWMLCWGWLGDIISRLAMKSGGKWRRWMENTQWRTKDRRHPRVFKPPILPSSTNFFLSHTHTILLYTYIKCLDLAFHPLCYIREWLFPTCRTCKHGFKPFRAYTSMNDLIHRWHNLRVSCPAL